MDSTPLSAPVLHGGPLPGNLPFACRVFPHLTMVATRLQVPVDRCAESVTGVAQMLVTQRFWSVTPARLLEEPWYRAAQGMPTLPLVADTLPVFLDYLDDESRHLTPDDVSVVTLVGRRAVASASILYDLLGVCAEVARGMRTQPSGESLLRGAARLWDEFGDGGAGVNCVDLAYREQVVSGRHGWGAAAERAVIRYYLRQGRTVASIERDFVHSRADFVVDGSEVVEVKATALDDPWGPQPQPRSLMRRCEQGTDQSMIMRAPLLVWKLDKAITQCRRTGAALGIPSYAPKTVILVMPSRWAEPLDRIFSLHMAPPVCGDPIGPIWHTLRQMRSMTPANVNVYIALLGRHPPFRALERMYPVRLACDHPDPDPRLGELEQRLTTRLGISAGLLARGRTAAQDAVQRCLEQQADEVAQLHERLDASLYPWFHAVVDLFTLAWNDADAVLRHRHADVVSRGLALLRVADAVEVLRGYADWMQNEPDGRLADYLPSAVRC